jgi:nucleoside-diphosphate-sugar epimerase
MPASVRDDINFNGIRNIAQAAVKNHVRGFLQASSISAYDYRYVIGKENIVEDDPLGSGDSPLYYMNSKAVTEKILNEILGPSDTRLTLFRLGYITGPCDESVIPEFRKNAFLALGQNPRMNFIQESDAARAFALAMQTSMPGAYNLVSDRTFRMSELYKTLGAKPIVMPLWMAYMVSYLLWRYFGSNMHPSFVREAFFDYVVSNQKLKATGWTPQYNGIEAVKTAI